MLNNPLNPFTPSHRPDSVSQGSWQTDQNPPARLVLLFAVLSFPLVLVLGRVVWLKSEVREDYLRVFDRTWDLTESIAATDGRILAADGRVLAYDEEFFTLEVHYRWLENPPDENWLKSQAYAQLDSLQRRDAVSVKQAQQETLARRDDLWSGLARLSGESLDQLNERRSRIQQRVERIVSRVEAQQQEREHSQFDSSPEEKTGPWWRRVWNRVSRTLTTPPRRESLDPVIVREELDYHPLLENIPFEMVAEIESHPQQFPGLKVSYATRRVYPEKAFAAHIIGHRAEISEEQRTENDPLDYQLHDRRGMAGIERSYDRVLHGTRGERRIVRNRQGEIISSEVIRKPRAGEDVILTIETALQERTEALLDAAIAPRETSVDAGGGSIVVIDVRTGELVVGANAPRHDLSLFTDFDADRWQALIEDPRRPFFPRATQMAIAPGSVFKTATTIALLQSGKIDPDEPYTCRGYLHSPERYRCYIYRHYGIGHGEIALREAIAQSCNVYFYQAGMAVGADEMIYWADKLGFGNPTGIDLPGEVSGNLPRPGRLTPGSRDRWHQSDTLGLAIGQSRLTVTPIQIAAWMA
ncbi:MAG TPA: penicillin-binding transpeptidase domain-containing protein, partial [Planctomycetaceae bacterium]|nr:penicillin-binding transpeptidase domain-containing protein [Planctomycetaceae bacterium]